MLFITIYIFFFTSYHMLLHNAGAHFHIIHNDLMIHITYISTKK